MPGKIFINETADKQKIELTTGADGVTGGYYDPEGVWHDFGGGGGGSNIQPLLTITFTDDTADNLKSKCWEIIEGHAEVDENFESPVNKGTTQTFLIPKIDQGGIVAYGFDLPTSSATDLVNCTRDYGYIFVTDPTQPASCTVKAYGGLG